MKTITFKSLLVTSILFLFELQGFAQSVGIRIDVQSANFSDKMWVFAIPTCTRLFDNGYDGFKMFGSPTAPQIYAAEATGNFQIDAIPDLNNTYIGFIAGMDTTYTLTITSQYLSTYYQSLYLIDSIANKTVDIYASGITYTFTATNKSAINRFKILTSLPIPPVIVKDTVPTTPVVIPPIVVTVTDSIISNPIVVPPTTTLPQTAVDGKKGNNNQQKLKIYNYGETLYIENHGKKGKIKIFNAFTGKVIKDVDFNADGITIIQSGVKKGTYIINGITPTEEVKKTILID
jgi:hypothetical protein